MAKAAWWPDDLAAVTGPHALCAWASECNVGHVRHKWEVVTPCRPALRRAHADGPDVHPSAAGERLVPASNRLSPRARRRQRQRDRAFAGASEFPVQVASVVRTACQRHGRRSSHASLPVLLVTLLPPARLGAGRWCRADHLDSHHRRVVVGCPRNVAIVQSAPRVSRTLKPTRKNVPHCEADSCATLGWRGCSTRFAENTDPAGTARADLGHHHP
jgi:hypothetical protein